MDNSEPKPNGAALFVLGILSAIFGPFTAIPGLIMSKRFRPFTATAATGYFLCWFFLVFTLFVIVSFALLTTCRGVKMQQIIKTHEEAQLNRRAIDEVSLLNWCAKMPREKPDFYKVVLGEFVFSVSNHEIGLDASGTTTEYSSPVRAKGFYVIPPGIWVDTPEEVIRSVKPLRMQKK